MSRPMSGRNAWKWSRRADQPPEAARQSDVIYGRKFGVALTMEVFTAGDSQRHRRGMGREQ